MDTQSQAEAQVDHVLNQAVNQEPSQVWPKYDDPNPEKQPHEVARDQPVEKLDARGLGIRVTKCGACDGCHDELQVNEYARPLGPFTHWYMCPTLHDPVNLSLGMMKLGDGLAFDGPIIQTLAKAQIEGRFMVVICYVHAEPDSEGKTVLSLSRHGCKFPTDKVYQTKGSEGLVGLLMRNLKEEFGEPQPVEMKKVEPHPLKSLLGRVDEAMHPLPPQ